MNKIKEPQLENYMGPLPQWIRETRPSEPRAWSNTAHIPDNLLENWIGYLNLFDYLVLPEQALLSNIIGENNHSVLQ